MNRVLSLIAVIVLGTGSIACVQDGPRSPKPVGGGCDGCELMYEGMPKELGWQSSIAGKGEPGEPLEIRGVIYRSDGKTPAPDVSCTSIIPTREDSIHPRRTRPTAGDM